MVTLSFIWAAVVLAIFYNTVTALRYDPEHEGWNLNENKEAVAPVDYWGEWHNHTYEPSPDNWRFPFYTVTLDRFVDGDPTNNEANGTVFEHNWMTNQFRFGGDVRGLQNDLDYIQGMGIKGIYLAGSPFINMPWSGDGYGPLDFTLLDRHHGTIEDWRALITEVHRRNMYVILDNTLATMGDLIAFKGYVNASAPFNWGEYDYIWKTDRRYHDFQPTNDYNTSCQYPRLWDQDGYLVTSNITDKMHGCMESEFDQYGDIKGVGAYPSWQSQLSKFASVQDRLKAWHGNVLDKLNVMSCMQIAMLDIDGFRMDKALQTTPDAQASFASYQRQCAKDHGKENFLIVGETVGEIPLLSVYFGRGKEPDMVFSNITDAMLATSETNSSSYIREFGSTALDASAFHYPTYGAMTRFLGLDGPIGFEGVDFVYHWNSILSTDDMVNANTGKFDPRHMFGVTNQDVFRWPSLSNGTQRQLLGLFITTLELPGIPLILWGEEQEYYVLENLADDYVFGRNPMASSRAWQLHGCYQLGELVYYEMPFNSSATACHDDSVSLDHRNPAHPLRNVLKRMYELRQQYPVFNDGYELQTLSTHLHDIYRPGSANITSPTGMWSVYRGRTVGVQDFSGTGKGNQGIWIVYQNENQEVAYEFDCSDNTTALISAFPSGTTVKNLFYPYEEFTLQNSTVKHYIEGSQAWNGCLANITLAPFEYKAFVPKSEWVEAAPSITRVLPSHDSRLLSTVPFGDQETVAIQIRFSREMSCDSVANNLVVESTTEDGQVAKLNQSSVYCELASADPPRNIGEIATSWIFHAELENVSNGVHSFTVKNATTKDNSSFTNANDKFFFRIGQEENPMVFPTSSNYSSTLLHQSTNGSLYVSHKAAGADKFRYSLNWGSSFSNWTDYTGGNTTLTAQPWSGTKAQEWSGQHVIVHYWSATTASSDHVQHGTLNAGDAPAQRWPHAYLEGSWNEYGYDGGLNNKLKMDSDGLWKFDLVAEWPTEFIVNVWGMNPDGVPDKSAAYGDVDGDGVLDWVPPDSLSRNVVNVTSRPPKGYLGYQIRVNDGNFHYEFVPVGSVWTQVVVGILLALVPLITGCAAVYIFKKSFYQVKFNEIGVTANSTFLSSFVAFKIKAMSLFKKSEAPTKMAGENDVLSGALAMDTGAPNRRSVLIATMEYEIEDWAIKIKIGGLGVMSSLMAKNLGHMDLIWVVPCVGDVEYPTDQPQEVMQVKILGQIYEIEVQIHVVRNITFVLLDAPVFRKQSRAEPYPARMDDMDSAIYYSAWNQCIAQAIQRFNVDIYHINDYHGAAAPLYLLPRIIPVCLSLHNAEFQGMWPLRTAQEKSETCRVYNLDEDVVMKYVQFGEVFNLLHAGASYLRLHQKGFGAVGVSTKYGKRSFARYPIFWGLNKVGALPNPDPSDTAEWDGQVPKQEGVIIDEEVEAGRGDLRKQAQEWAGLNIDPTAELFVFVGRWSQQKGIDLIADVFYSILSENPRVQLVCVGPVIDLYGKFAALKLSKLMEKFPGRVYSKPEFTALPPCIFSGAEFALIPSRDEPFGLVAVEFGRKGALGVGARVGGLGQMPGWWYTVESTTTKHLITQFKSAIRNALASKDSVRAMMRARSSLQRFPVVQWVEKIEKLQTTSLAISKKEMNHHNGLLSAFRSSTPDFFHTESPSESSTALPTPIHSVPQSRVQSRAATPVGSRVHSRAPSPVQEEFITVPNPDENGSSETGPARKIRVRSAQAHSRSGSALSLSSVLDGEKHDRHESIAQGLDDHHRGRTRLSMVADDDLPSRDSSPIVRPRRSMQIHSTAHSRASSPGLSSTRESMEGGNFYQNPRSIKSSSLLDLSAVVGDHTDLYLQKTDPFFVDSNGVYYNKFEKLLDSVDSKSSEDQLCIEKYLVKSEKQWFSQRHEAKLGRSPASTPASSIFRFGGWQSRPASIDGDRDSEQIAGDFFLGDHYKTPTGLRKFMQLKIGKDWQIYSLVLAFGQIIAANSYQITLLTGQNGQSANKLYVMASIYLAASMMWWLVFRTMKSIYVLSLPFVLYGLAFFILGMSPFVNSIDGRGWIYNVATALYAIASASGSFFFSLNFGEEGGSQTRSWVYRACVIQGTQQLYIAFLWYWGSTFSTNSANGTIVNWNITTSRTGAAITIPIAFLLWAVGLVLFLGLPTYYRQTPGKVGSFYASLLKRKIVLWFFVMVILQNYWLSAPYGRNWRYLWSSNLVPTWSIVVLVLVFFIFVWGFMLWILGGMTMQHSWVMPLFAIGLGAPRWCQILWGISNIGLYVPWGSQAVGVLLGRSLWCWLGVLDSLQGVGFGMILLQTLTRFHIAFTLIAAQIIGSVATIAARASAPNSTGPGTVFPDFATSYIASIQLPWFWVGLFCQLIICVGFTIFFRKEQLSKP